MCDQRTESWHSFLAAQEALPKVTIIEGNICSVALMNS